MSHLLDDLAAAFQEQRSRLVVKSLELREQFESGLTPEKWENLGKKLSCQLPPLKKTPPEWLWERDEWYLPAGWSAVSDLTNYVARELVGQPTASVIDECTLDDWYDAQIFAGVRKTLVNALGVDNEEVSRESELIKDLGA